MTTVKYDKGLFRRSVNEMIVLNELPFAFVESEGFRRFCSKNLLMIISFKPVIDHKGDTISSHLIGCLEEWGIEKVFTVTIDNAKENDKALGLFMDALMMKGPDALVRHGDRFKYFLLRVETGNVSREILSLDVATRWNSTYLMLTAAIKFRVAFEKLLVEDKLYNEYFMEKEDSGEDGARGENRVGPPTFANWNEVQRLVKFMRIFFNCTLSFYATKSMTSSIAYNDIVVIERNLINLSCNNDSLLKTETMVMRSKFEKYWDDLINMNPLVIIANSVETTHLRSSIKSVMKKLYEEYASKLSPTPSQGESSSATRSDNGESVDASAMFDLSDDDGYERMDSLYSEMVSDTAYEESSSELDMYLMEKPKPRTQYHLGLDYDVLSWWRRNSSKFPILAELARDVLAIQVSSVGPESAFSTSGRILDPYQVVCHHTW
ncbi:PREDICTED: zinc finger BED domain-containing protein RICESLEEPER 2-like [Camelina sativa]|uniref:Zinc finger BED domain-containing protein RICESLEEPER 2-like n=1 Tax=Camelina sativa TaxID=90675 RepID=A0ABM1QBS3_CAMSA|nr:PREDICTED: zinc finger BED domain-containing protein RICESLEEPER 2-like [Camelina sativa]